MAGQCDHQGHDAGHHRHLLPNVERALWVAFGLNAVFLVVELVVGVLADSLALLSDAGHMVSDVAALGLALGAQRLARTEPSSAFTFGLRRVPVLGALGNGLSLLIIAALILWEAWRRLEQAPEVAAMPVLIAGLLGLLINAASAWYLHRSSAESLNIRGAILHLLADALGSFGAIVAALVLLITGWTPIDALVSAVIASLLLISTWSLLRDSIKVLLQGAPPGCRPDRIREALREHPVVADVADLHIWQIDVGQNILSAALITEERSLTELETVAADLKARLRDEFSVLHITFEWCTPAYSVTCNIGQQHGGRGGKSGGA